MEQKDTDIRKKSIEFPSYLVLSGQCRSIPFSSMAEDKGQILTSHLSGCFPSSNNRPYLTRGNARLTRGLVRGGNQISERPGSIAQVSLEICVTNRLHP
ncbi:hypothetical protein CEXT_543341 [Caerostris extrusa]|uniref:Uncharacterized protein n=1 Tax=Caerostris extrusa TaxID=172846 RepID=A0AAV4VP60_CAEEX|nr:hypothetical protein CEXT_543341 [Caerostris extrusa]